MQVNIANHKATVIENGVYYFAPSNYPHITPLEIKNLLAFYEYEKLYGRQTKFVCEEQSVITVINHAIAHPDTAKDIPLPEKIVCNGCACMQNGCITEFVYHATDLKATQNILSSGKLLSAVKVSGKTADVLAYEKRCSVWNDPEDFFEYIMFCWGNCVVGDYVVMSDDPGGEFTPSIRFYFRYENLLQHPGHLFDGYHCIKVKNEILLSDYLYACIVPDQYKDELDRFVLPELASKVHYIPQKGLRISEWSERVYKAIEKLNKRNTYISNGTLSLVEYRKSDDRALYENWLDPGAQKGYNGIYVTTFANFQRREIKQRFFAMIRVDSTDEIIGAVGISPPETVPDLAIWIFKPYRRKGYGTSAFALATKYATETLKTGELHAGAYPDNIGSQKMLERCGYAPFPDGNIPEKHYITGEDIVQKDYIYIPKDAYEREQCASKI